mmetsp:Transcript_26830/g.39915  ORF Transcript_26830/g.39915 Transcript_26830/m.39915 type:complete len:89 (-) Transcript_26830:422-688(-)
MSQQSLETKENATGQETHKTEKSSFFCFFLPHLLLEGRRSPPRQPHQPPTKQNVPYPETFNHDETRNAQSSSLVYNSRPSVRRTTTSS